MAASRAISPRAYRALAPSRRTWKISRSWSGIGEGAVRELGRAGDGLDHPWQDEHGRAHVVGALQQVHAVALGVPIRQAPAQVLHARLEEPLEPVPCDLLVVA